MLNFDVLFIGAVMDGLFARIQIEERFYPSIQQVSLSSSWLSLKEYLIQHIKRRHKILMKLNEIPSSTQLKDTDENGDEENEELIELLNQRVAPHPRKLIQKTENREKKVELENHPPNLMNEPIEERGDWDQMQLFRWEMRLNEMSTSFIEMNNTME